MKNYELLSKYYDEIQKMDYKYFIELVNDFIDGENKTVLDIGSGTGKFTKMLLDNFYEPIGLDKSHENIELSQNNYPYIKFIEADYLTYNFTNKFDFATAFMDVLNYFISDEEINSFFKKSSMILKDKGLLLLDINSISKLSLHNFEKEIIIEDQKINWSIKVENQFLKHTLLFADNNIETHIQRIENTQFYENKFAKYFELIFLEEYEDRIFLVLQKK